MSLQNYLLLFLFKVFILVWSFSANAAVHSCESDGVSATALASINAAALQACVTNYSTVSLTTPGVYQLNATINVPSNETISLGAGVFLVRVNGGNAVTLFQNANPATGNQNIKLTGQGVLYCNANGYQNIYNANPVDTPYFSALYTANLPGIKESGGSIYEQSPFVHCLFWENVDNLSVGGGLTVMMADKYEIYGRGITHFTFDSINLYSDDVINPANLSTNGRDGIHIQGNSHNGVISNIAGTTNDDFMVLNVRDVSNWANDAVATGNITNIKYLNISGKNQRRGGDAIHLYGGLDTASALRQQLGTVSFSNSLPSVVNIPNNFAAGLPASTPVFFTTTGTLPTGIAPGVIYWASNPTPSGFQVSAVYGGPIINVTSKGTGTHTAWYVPLNNKSIQSNGFDLAPEIVGISAVSTTGRYSVQTASAHNMVAGQHFTIYGALPVGYNTAYNSDTSGHGAAFGVAGNDVQVGTVISVPDSTHFIYQPPVSGVSAYAGNAILVRYYQLANININKVMENGGYGGAAVSIETTLDARSVNYGIIENLTVNNATGTVTNPDNGAVIELTFARLANSSFTNISTQQSIDYGLFSMGNTSCLVGLSSWFDIYTQAPYPASTVGATWFELANYQYVEIGNVDADIIPANHAANNTAIRLGSSVNGNAIVYNSKLSETENNNYVSLVKFYNNVGTASIINPQLDQTTSDTTSLVAAFDGSAIGGNVSVSGINLTSAWKAPMIVNYGSGTLLNVYNNTLTAPSAGNGGLIQNLGKNLSINAYENNFGADRLINPHSSGTYSSITYDTLSSPAISSGFGAGAYILKGGTAESFKLNVGTGSPGAIGVITMPASVTGWRCTATDQTNASSMHTIAASTSMSSITLNNSLISTGFATAWMASDLIAINCTAY